MKILFKFYWLTIILFPLQTALGFTGTPDSTAMDTLRLSPGSPLTSDTARGKTGWKFNDSTIIINPDILQHIEEVSQHFLIANSQWDMKDFDSLAFFRFLNAPDSVIKKRFDSLNLYTPFELEYNKQVKSYIELYAGKRPRQLLKMIRLSKYYFPVFLNYLDKYDLPYELKYLPVIESALNPVARSRAGAKGLWQFMYSTGKMYGLKANSITDDRFDIEKSTDAACRHLNDLHNIYDDWSLALAAYNSGVGNVNKALRRAGGVKNYWAIWPFLPRETRGYVPAFLSILYIMSYADNMLIQSNDTIIPYLATDTVMVKEVLSFEQLNEFLKVPMDTLKFLNPAYKKGIIPASQEKPYALRLPLEFIGPFIDQEQELYAYKTKAGIAKEELKKQIAKAKERTVHIVRSGENLSLIAQKYHTSVRKIKEWNGLRSNRIYPGKRLIVYEGGTYYRKKGNSAAKRKKTTQGKGKYIYHTVRKGETLWDIARMYKGLTVKKLKRLNGIRNTRRLKPGQKLKIRKRS